VRRRLVAIEEQVTPGNKPFFTENTGLALLFPVSTTAMPPHAGWTALRA